MTTTRRTQHLNAPCPQVYQALLDPTAVTTWMVPDGMTSHIHEFEARVGGCFRISLTYDAPTDTGKTSALPSGIAPADNELGRQMSLDRVARLVEGKPIDE